ncbi:MAG: hypothetical protein PHH73_00160 [Candidatus Rickettsiella isopodorum]|nr:hypothetical protein [Candidatus Rickettsiella isopodorum]
MPLDGGSIARLISNSWIKEIENTTRIKEDKLCFDVINSDKKLNKKEVKEIVYPKCIY